MNEPGYLLQSFGFSAYSLQNGMSSEIIEDAALKIKQLPPASYNICVIDISNKLLPVIQDAKFSPIWVVLFDGLSSLYHQDEVQAIYRQINEKQAEIFSMGSLPKDILHRLWLSHLPCLEFAVLKLVEHVCSEHHLFSATLISETLKKSCLVEIASIETIIYETVFQMLMSMLVSSDFGLIMTEITATFCHMVRAKASQFAFQTWMTNSSGLSGRVHQLEAMLSPAPDPETLSSLCILNTFHKLHTTWKDIEKGAAGSDVICTPELSPSSDTTCEVTSCHHFEDLYCLTVQYRSWMFAALNNILSCDQQYVESCLWYVAAHHRIKLCSLRHKILEIGLNNFVCGLRDLMNTSNQHSELASQVTSLAGEASLAMEFRSPDFKAPEKIYQRMTTFSRSVISLLLMTFLFHSDGGFNVGNEIAAIVTRSKDITDHSRCLIYHYHVLNMTARQWSSDKRDRFLSFVHGLYVQLENKNSVKEISDFLHIHNGLNSILLDLK